LEKTAQYEQLWALSEDLDLEESFAEEFAECDRLVASQKSAKQAWYQRPPVWAAACCLLVLSSLLITYQLKPTRYTTSIGEQRLVVLEDGTRVSLNTNTELTFKNGAIRKIVLIKGEGYFDVAHDPKHPFVVETPAGTARAVGTEYSVRLNNDTTLVTVIEGLVAVAGTNTISHTSKLGAGESISLLSDGTPTQVEQVDTTEIRYWREGKVYFKNKRLDTSVAEFNRYLDRKLVIGNRELNELHIGGVFQINDVDGFLFALDELFDIETIESPNAIVLMRK
jgi:transmembrane sensor